MTASMLDLLEGLADRGITMRRVGEQISCGPKSRLNASLIERIRRHKPELLPALERGGEAVTFGTVNTGWHPLDWATRLRQMAAVCESVRLDRAVYLCRWAGVVERRAVGLQEVFAAASDDELIDLRERFEERAAIAEFDGMAAAAEIDTWVPRRDALRLAAEEVRSVVERAERVARGAA